MSVLSPLKLIARRGLSMEVTTEVGSFLAGRLIDLKRIYKLKAKKKPAFQQAFKIWYSWTSEFRTFFQKNPWYEVRNIKGLAFPDGKGWEREQ